MTTDRLLRRATGPGGVIDVREPQRRVERAAEWSARHLSVASSVWQRYLPDAGPGGDAGLPYASHPAPPVAALPAVRAEPAVVPVVQRKAIVPSQGRSDSGKLTASESHATVPAQAVPTQAVPARDVAPAASADFVASPVDAGPAAPARLTTQAVRDAAMPSPVTRIVGPVIQRWAAATPLRETLPLADPPGADPTPVSQVRPVAPAQDAPTQVLPARDVTPPVSADFVASPADPGPAAPARMATQAGRDAGMPSRVTRIVGPAIQRRAEATLLREALPLPAAAARPAAEGLAETPSGQRESLARLVIQPPTGHVVQRHVSSPAGVSDALDMAPKQAARAPASAAAAGSVATRTPLLVQRKAIVSQAPATAWQQTIASATPAPAPVASDAPADASAPLVQRKAIASQPATPHGRVATHQAQDAGSVSPSLPVPPAPADAIPLRVQRKTVASSPPDMVWRRGGAPATPFAVPMASPLHAVPALSPGPLIQREAQDAAKGSGSTASPKAPAAPATPAVERARPPVPDVVDQVMRKVLRQLAVEQERRGGGRWS